MRILVTGACGQLGWDLMDELAARGHDALGTDIAPPAGAVGWKYAYMDITDPASVREVTEAFGPEAIVHCAAWTQVDLAEEPENLEKVRALNVSGTENIAGTCKRLGCRMLYISTDYVFDGGGDEPWLPDHAGFSPLSVYGQTKLQGELAVREALDKYFIVRIAWVFGRHGGNFVSTMLRLSETHTELRVVNDQIGAPTYTYHLSRLLADMCGAPGEDKYGVYHATNGGGYISWYGFAREIFRQARRDVLVRPVSTSEYGLSKARRPFNSRLDCRKLQEAGFRPLPPWQEALEHYLRSAGIIS